MGLESSFSTGLRSQVTNGGSRQQSARSGVLINQRSPWRLPPERRPSDRAASVQAGAASLPSCQRRRAAFHLIASVLQKKVPSQLLHASDCVPRLPLQHLSEPLKERSSPRGSGGQSSPSLRAFTRTQENQIPALVSIA